MRGASPVSRAGSLYQTGSAHALFPRKNVVVFIMRKQASPLAEISAQATRISASGSACLLI